MKASINKKRIWAITIIILTVVACIAILITSFFDKKKHVSNHKKESCCESCSKGLTCDSKAVTKKGNIKHTLNDLGTSEVIAKSLKKKTDTKVAQNPNVSTGDSATKLTTADGAVDFSLDKFRVLPPKEDKSPEIDVVGGIEIHLDKPRKNLNKVMKHE
ncbi:MAG: hypothetical protein HRU36_03125 [Rickettsiales bacterium]|nr:hypothetical protein [Rickettsiales bacterium]